MIIVDHRNNHSRYIFQVLKILGKSYPNSQISLKYSNPWELLVAVILSAQCTDKTVNKVTSNIFAKYRKFDDYVSVKPGEFEKDIKSTGFYRNKAKNILASAKIIKTKFGGNIPSSMEDLLILPGVARKTANIILGTIFHKNVGIAVDTHVHRISQRLRFIDVNSIGGKKKYVFKRNNKEVLDFIKDADPYKIEQQLMKIIPSEDWYAITYQFIEHGRAVCKAVNPNCSSCALRHLCPSCRI